MVADALDAVVDSFPTCRALAFADLGTSMVLLANSQSDLSRERLDALCAEALATLGPVGEAPLGVGTVDVAMTATPAVTKLFLRDGEGGVDGLLCLCDAQTDLEALLPELADCLERILAG